MTAPASGSLASTSTPFFTRYRLACLAILLGAGLIYLPALRWQPMWDDVPLMSATTAPTTAWACFTHPFLGLYFRPLTALSFMLDRRLFGPNPFLFHQTNILLHVLTTGCVIGLVCTAFCNRRIGLLAGALFAAQPAQVSAVAWIGGRTDAIAALFVTLFAWSVLASARSMGRRRTLLYWTAVFFYALSALAKEQDVLLIMLVPAAFCWFQPSAEHCSEVESAGRWRWSASVPFLTIAAADAAIWLTCFPPIRVVNHEPIGDRIVVFARTVGAYAALLAFPTPRTMSMYSLSAVEQMGSWTATGGVAVVALVLWFGRRLRTQSRPAAWFLLLAGISLFPVLNLVPYPSIIIAPYRAGVGGIGAAAIVAWAAFHPATQGSRWGKLRLPVLVGYAGAMIALCAWGVACWQDEETVTRVILSYDPGDMWARQNQIAHSLQQGRSAEAETEIQILLEETFRSGAWRQPNTALAAYLADRMIAHRLWVGSALNMDRRAWIADRYAALASIQLGDGRFADCVASLRAGAAFDPGGAMLNLVDAGLRLQQGNLYAAESAARAAIARDPKAAPCHRTLGDILARQGRYREAALAYRVAIRLAPVISDAYLALAEVEVKLHDRSAAAKVLEDCRARAFLPPPDIGARIAALRRGR